MKITFSIILFCCMLSACSKHVIESEPIVAVKPKPDSVKTLPKTSDFNQKNLRVVAMGSSTIAGGGPLSQDSTIMNRIKRWALDQLPLSIVINLGVGGATTFHGLPTAQPGPPGFPEPNASLNTDAVLRQKPDLAIVSFPSNDFTLNVTAALVEQNFIKIYNALDSKNVKVILLGIQPRNLKPEQIAMQNEVDAFLKTRFGDRYVQVYSKLKNADGSIKNQYSAGDGIHLNNAGHRILFESIVAQCSGMFLNN